MDVETVGRFKAVSWLDQYSFSYKGNTVVIGRDEEKANKKKECQDGL